MKQPLFYDAEQGQFKGYQDFGRLMEKGDIHPGQQIRIQHSSRLAREEEHYVIGTQGQAFNNKQQPIDLEKALEEAESWSFEGCNLLQLPEEETEKLLEE